MSAQPLPHITPEQYLAADRAAEFKSEYYRGRMYSMSGATLVHSFLIGNVTSELSHILSDRPCIVCPTDLRTRVSPEGLFTYPDIIVICGEPQYADERNDTVLNPALIVEVISKSTEADDRGFKFAQYRQLESLREYVLISQNEPRVEKFQNQLNGAWMLSESVGWDAVCELPSLDTRIPLSRIYRKVKFSDGVASVDLEGETNAAAETARRVDQQQLPSIGQR